MGEEDSRMIEGLTSTTFFVAGAAIVVLVAVAFIRIARGPTAPDRVVALDTINTLVVALLICLSAGFKTLIYMDIAIVYALLSFVTTLYISHYIGEAK
jgi:multicomponent Na+:H+ antiporter subunit F